MSVKKHVVKSCCGSQSIILEADKPLRKYQIDVFREAGYLVPDNYLKLGIFYGNKNGIVATAAFGTTKIQIRANSTDAPEIENFILLLEQAINKTS